VTASVPRQPRRAGITLIHHPDARQSRFLLTGVRLNPASGNQQLARTDGDVESLHQIAQSSVERKFKDGESASCPGTSPLAAVECRTFGDYIFT
jgi:hypothetical protein